MKDFGVILMVLLVGATQVFAFGFAPAKYDKWFGADKFEHLVIHTLFTSYVYSVDRPLFTAEKTNNAKVAKIAFYQSFSTGFVYEVNDGFTSVGEGFPYRDMCYNVAGATLGTYLTYKIKPNGLLGFRRFTKNGLINLMCACWLAALSLLFGIRSLSIQRARFEPKHVFLALGSLVCRR